MEPVFVSHHCPEMAPVFIVFLITFIVLMALIATIVKVLVFCKIFSKAGYSWALGLLMLIPVVDIIMIFFLAFADWPVRRELRLLKHQQEKART